VTPSLRSPIRYVISTIAVCFTVLTFYKLFHAVPTTAALMFLLVVLSVAAVWGLRLAIYTSLLSTLCLNFFFLPPVRTLTIADPQNWVALFAFLATSVLASQLSERARSEAAEAKRRRSEVERLYSFSQQLLLYDNPKALLKNAPQAVSETFGTFNAALYLLRRDRLYRHGTSDSLSLELMRETAQRGEPFSDPEKHITIVPVRLGIKVTGAIGFSGEQLSQNTLDALGSLIAAAIERANAVESLAHAEAARESERLRSALLDSITHELRTPLTSIKASVSSLRSDFDISPEARAEMLAVIEEETDRLNRLVGEAVVMAQLDSHDVQLDMKPHRIQTAVTAALENTKWVQQRHPIEIRIPSNLPAARMDIEWITKVVQHLLENAAKYSEEGSPIFISAELKDGRIVTSVADRGVGIDDLERSMIFDKFYRGQRQRFRVHGTGMGLAIVKAIVEAHGGAIDVTSQLEHGSVFSFSLLAVT
jgi:two-component system sensor histidine kinase KdpD